MTDNPQSDPIVPEHTVQITHYHRPAGAAGAWSQYTTAQLTFEDAVAWLLDKVHELFPHSQGAPDTAVEAQTATPAGDGQPPPAEASTGAPVVADTAGEVTT